MVLPVGEDAAAGREHRAALGPAQGEDEASDARVRRGREQLGRLHARGQGALQVLHQVLDGHADVRAVAHDQRVGRRSEEAVGGRGDGGFGPVYLDFYGVRRHRRGIGLRTAGFIQHLLEKDFEEFFESQLHLETKRELAGAV